MRKIDDVRFAKVLLDMGKADGTRLNSPESRDSDLSVALWTAHELQRHAEELSVDSNTSRELRGRADEILQQVARARRNRTTI